MYRSLDLQSFDPADSKAPYTWYLGVYLPSEGHNSQAADLGRQHTERTASLCSLAVVRRQHLADARRGLGLSTVSVTCLE